MYSKNHLFTVETGEDAGYEFFVYAENYEEALAIAQEEFEGEYLAYGGVFTDWQAESYGLDTI